MLVVKIWVKGGEPKEIEEVVGRIPEELAPDV